MELFEMKMDKNLVIIILCITVNWSCAITNHGTRHIPLRGWRATSTGEQPGAYFDRDEYRNYRRNPVTFFDQDRNTEVRQPSDSYFDRNGGREIRNTDDFPKPQLPWEEALRHSVYLTLVRDKIDSLLVKQAGSDRQNLKVHERTKDDGEIADVNLWRNIQKAQLKQNSKEKGPVFGDIAILSRGKLIESFQGYEFVEDEDVKECIECHLFTARHNEVEAERILTSRCDGPDCSNQRIKALWTVRRIRHRNPEGEDPPFTYELMFSIASPKPDRTNLDYNEPSQTFSIQEADKSPKLPRKHERKGKFIFQDEKPQDYNKGYHSPQGTTVVQSYGDVRTEGPPWYDGFNAGKHQQQSTEHPPYLNRYPEFYPNYQESSTRLNTGEKYPTRDEEFRYKNPPYMESSVQSNANVNYRGHNKLINVKVNSEESTVPENVRSHKALRDFKIPTITHLHHHYYLNDKGVPVMKPSKFENHNNFEVYLPNGYIKGTTASNQNTPYSEDEEYNNDQHSGIDEPAISDSNPKKANLNTNSSPQLNENRVTIPFYTTNSMSLQTETTEEEEVTTISSVGRVTLSESQFYRKPVKFVESTQHEVKLRQRKLRPTKPFRPSPVDERMIYSELDPLYMPTSSTPTAFTSEAQVINLKNPYVEVNNFSEEKPIYEENQEDYPDDNPTGPVQVSFDDNKESTEEIPNSSHENPTAESEAISNENHEETSEDDSDQTPESVNVNQEGSSEDTSEESFNNQSGPIQTPLETNEEEKYTEPAVTEKIVLLSEVGTTIENIYLPEFSDSNEQGDHNNNMPPSGERTTLHVQATQPSYTTQYQDANEHTSTTRKINDHRIQRKPYKPNRRVKLQKKFSELIKSQLPSPRSGGTTLPYGSAVTAVYEEKMDTVPELQNNSSIVSPFRKLRQRTTPSALTSETITASTVTEVYVEKNLETEPQSYNSTSAPLNVQIRKLRQRQSTFIPNAGTSPAVSLVTEVHKQNTNSESNSTYLAESVPVRPGQSTFITSTGSSVADEHDEQKYSEKMDTDSGVSTFKSIRKLRQRQSTLLPTTGISTPYYDFTLVTEKYEENINSEKTGTVLEPQDNSTQTPLANTSTSVRKLKQRPSTLSQTMGISTPYAYSSVTEKYEDNNHSEKMDKFSESQDNNSTQMPLANTPISIKKIRQRHSSLPTTGSSTPYASSTAAEKYEENNHTEKIDTVSESANNSTSAPVSPIRRLRQRNSTFIPPRISTSTFIPQRVSNNSTFNHQTISRRKYQRKLGTWTTSHLRPKLLTEKPLTSTTEVTTEATTDFTDEENKMTTVYDDVMKTVMDQNTTIHYKEIGQNETTPNKTDKNIENRYYSDSEVNASEHSFEITELPGNTENDSTEGNESTEPTTISETTEITSISEEEESSPSMGSTIATLQTTETSSKPYSKSDEEIFTPLTKKSFVTSISLKLGNRTRPYYQRSTEHPRKGGLRFIDQLKLTENTTFMADLLSRFNMDDTMKAKISEVNHAGKEIKIHKAEETSHQIKIQGVAKVDNITRQIIQHGKFVK